MKFRKSWKRFWTLDRHHSDGFTLVELIVVIAILAILAGVGTVGYSGYIKSANKNADKVLVGNIIRALETGLYSTSFDLKNVMQIGDSDAGFKYPVGYIVLTQNGIQSLESATQTTSDEPCALETVNGPFNVYVTNFKLSCGLSSGTVYQYKTVDSITYCETHYDNPIVEGNKVNPSGSNIRYTTYSEAEIKADKNKENEVKNAKNPPAGGIYNLGTGYGHDHKEGTVVNKYGTYMENTTNNKIDPVLAAAFGSDFKTTLKLKSSDWTTGTMSTFFNNATATVGKMETLSGKLVSIIGTVGTSIGGKQFVENEHESSADLIMSVADRVTGITAVIDNKTVTGEDAFVFYWEEVDKTGSNAVAADGAPAYDTQGFGMGGREYYSAARLAYNEAFASYLTACGHSEHAEQVSDFGEKAADLINMDGLGGAIVNAVADVKLPKTVCRSALDPDSTVADSGIRCQTCYDLYNKYVSEGVSKANAKAFYETMETFKETGNYANDGADDAAFFDYYDNYLKEFQGLNNSVASMTQGKSAIVIVLYIEDGLLVAEVSPNAANPRND